MVHGLSQELGSHAVIGMPGELSQGDGGVPASTDGVLAGAETTCKAKVACDAGRLPCKQIAAPRRAR